MWEEALADEKPALVVFDSFADMLANSDLDENNAVDVTSWIKGFCDPVKRSGGAVLILDHVTKGEGAGTSARGSGAKVAKMDVAWGLKRDKAFDRECTGLIALSRSKDRNGSMPSKHEFMVGGDGTGKLIFSPEDAMSEKGSPGDSLTDKARKALEVLKDFPDGLESREWRVATGIAESTFHRAKKQLVEGCYVRQEGNRYLLSPDPSL
jgi:hypothetical protein